QSRAFRAVSLVISVLMEWCAPLALVEILAEIQVVCNDSKLEQTGLFREDSQKRSAASRPDSVRGSGSARCAMRRTDWAKSLKTTIIFISALAGSRPTLRTLSATRCSK